jgi:rubrerythrin
MPEFVNPFSGTVPESKLTHEELVRAIRLNVAAEHEAIHLYMAHAEATDHPLAKKVLVDIANEERVHVGEFERLLEILTGDEDKWVAEGREEVDEMAATLSAADTAGAENAEADAPKSGGEERTIGSLKDSTPSERSS